MKKFLMIIVVSVLFALNTSAQIARVYNDIVGYELNGTLTKCHEGTKVYAITRQYSSNMKAKVLIMIYDDKRTIYSNEFELSKCELFMSVVDKQTNYVLKDLTYIYLTVEYSASDNGYVARLDKLKL